MAKSTRSSKKAIPEGAKKPAARSSANAAKADGSSVVLAVLAAMSQPDRALGERIHALVKASAPDLVPKLWYGMPAYAREGKVVCFFQSAAKFKTRYATLGFMHEANLDKGGMWPTAFAVTELTTEDEAMISKLVKKAVRLGA